MSGRKRKIISCLFSSSKKLKRWKSDGTEEFSLERALCDRGLYYNQDECTFCPSVFHLFAGFLTSWGMVIKKISGDKIFCVKETAVVSIYTPFQTFWYFFPMDFCARIVDVCLFQVVISHQVVVANWPMPASVSAEGILTPTHRNLMKPFSPFSR